MRIEPVQLGSIVLKQAFLHPGRGIRRRLNLFLPGEWAAPVPILAWLIHHEGQRILVDMGDVGPVKDPPFARHSVTVEDELPAGLERLGFSCSEIDLAVVTHLHPDHFHGAVNLEIPVLIGSAEWQAANAFGGRLFQKLSGVSVNNGINFSPVDLDDGPFGAFEQSRKLTADGRVLLVPTPGHTSGHCSVIAIDDEGRHVMLAADATDSLEQLLDRRADAVASQVQVQVKTIERILSHAASHPTIYLPTHDPESISRLAASELVDVSSAVDLRS